MSRKTRAKGEKKKELLAKGYIECYYCDEPVKPSAMRCPSCGKIFSSGKKMLALVVAAVVIISATAYVYIGNRDDEGSPVNTTMPSVVSNAPIGSSISTGSTISVTFSNNMVVSSVQSAFSTVPQTWGTFSWSGKKMTYTPSQPFAAATTYRVTIGSGAKCVCGNPLDCGIYAWSFTTAGSVSATRRSVGTGDDNFWTVNPADHTSPGATVNHPQWVRTAVENKVLVILTHSEGCAPCITMTEIFNKVKAKYGSQLAYYDLLSGTNEPQATETFAAYDPNGEPHYIPLPIIISKGPGSEIIWHSWEGVVYEYEFESWIDDALSYHSGYA